LVRELGLGTVSRQTVVAAWAAKLDVLAFNRALGFGLDDPALPEELDAAIADFYAAGVPRCMFQISPDAEPRALQVWLLDRGFYHHNNWIKQCRRAEPMTYAGGGDVRVEKIGRERAPDFGRIVAGAFGFPEPVGALCAATIGRPNWQHYLAYAGDEPIATGALFVHEGIGWLGMAGTRFDRRGRGGQGALIARRVSDAARLGCARVVTETAEEKPDHPAPSYRNLRRMGFEVTYLRPNFVKVMKAG
jgi:hypothetical protein